MTAKGWQREFEDPIPLPSRRKLITLAALADVFASMATSLATAGGAASPNQSVLSSPLLPIRTIATF